MRKIIWALAMLLMFCLGCSSKKSPAQRSEGDSALRSRLRIAKIQTILPQAMRDHGLDLWLVVTRENNRDPLSADIGAEYVVARSAFIFFDRGDALQKIAIVASYDVTPVEQSAIYDTLIVFKSEGLAPHLKEQISRLNPKKIGVDISEDESIADGLSAGNLRWLERTLGPEFSKRIVSAENMVISFRGRKTPEEVQIIREGVKLTQEILAEALSRKVISPGKTTEKNVAEFIKRRMEAIGVGPAWEADQCPNVVTGTSRGHSGPTDAIIQRGQVVYIDFGINYKGYCTDIQRTAYVLKQGETKPPMEIQKMWETCLQANRAAVQVMKPGTTGLEVDTAARKVITDASYAEYPHGTGHPIGFFTHDVGPLLGPNWPERYGKKVFLKLEVGQTFAVEPAVTAPLLAQGGEARIGLEEDVVITERGAEYLGTPQTELILIQ